MQQGVFMTPQNREHYVAVEIWFIYKTVVCKLSIYRICRKHSDRQAAANGAYKNLQNAASD